MILWTIVPLEQVFDNSQDIPAFEEIDYSDVKLIVEKLSPAQYRIVRIVSTDPNHFLRPEVQPGKLLNYKLATETLSS